MTYNYNMYKDRDSTTRASAERIVSVLLDIFLDISSVLDIGCGTGTFLSIFEQRGINDVLGVEGPWVKDEYLEINGAKLIRVNLVKQFPVINRKFDIALCLEVGEHLPETFSRSLVDFLCEKSDLVLFSAAIPHQGGEGHINEQWQSYWVELFMINGFELNDCIRPIIWDDNEIMYWYRQNMLIFEKRRGGGDNSTLRNVSHLINLVHPQSYLKKISKPTSLQSRLLRKLLLFLGR